MTAPVRRDLLKLAASAMLLPALGALPARAIAGVSRFAPPATLMLYSRQLRREMVDGASFAVKRQFAVQFKPTGIGFQVTGEQVAVNIDAPERLAAFAQLERDRVESNLFPLTLDAFGHIHGDREPSESVHLDAAVREATSRLSKLDLSAAEREGLSRFVTTVHQSATRALTELPQDLFAPVEPVRTATRDVALPGGDAGAVTVRFSASTDPATGMMRQAEREVVTDLSGDRRRTVETWSLTGI